MSKPRLGYLINSHVMYQHAAIPTLLESMALCGIRNEDIMVNVNGSGRSRCIMTQGVMFCFVQGEMASAFTALVNEEIGEKLGIQHWMLLNCTSKCGPRFKELAEAGFNPDADATLAGALLPIGPSGGKHGRAINDLAVYRYDYLLTIKEKINSVVDATMLDVILDLEGWYFAHAPNQAFYPQLGYQLDTTPRDVYGSGSQRAVEYYPGLDLYRFKRNYGQLPFATYTHTL